MQREPSTGGVGLIRALGPWMATAVVIGTVIGSGIFKKPQAVAASIPYTGLAALVWVVGGLLALLGALALAEVCVLYPKAGGNYVFLREGYGRLFGFLWGWIEFWIIRGASIAALANIFTEQLHTILAQSAGRREVLGFWSQQAITVALIMVLALVNVRGVRWGGVTQLIITTVKIGSLLTIIGLPLYALLFAGPETRDLVRSSNLVPVLPSGADGSGAGSDVGSLLARIGVAMLGVLWAYHGWMNIAPVAEEVRDPQRNLPLALIAGTMTIIALYLGANLAYALVIPQDEMAKMKDTSAAAYAPDGEGTEPPQNEDRTVAIGLCRRLLGGVGVGIAAAMVMISVFGALNGNLLVGPRVLYAMGADGLAPLSLGRVHPRFHTPATAILVMGAWASLLVLAAGALIRYQLPEMSLGGWHFDPNPPRNKPLFDVLTDLAMIGAVIFETLAVASIFVFRWRYPDTPREYRCPGYPLVPLLYVAVMVAVAINTLRVKETRIEAFVCLAFVAVGAAVYLAVFRGRARA